MEAKKLDDLIDWTEVKLHEPLLTCNLSKEELLSIMEAPMTVPKLPVH